MAFVASQKQQDVFKFIEHGRGSAVLIAVAGSGKSTTIVQSLRFIPERDAVSILAFNATIAKEMKAKIESLGQDIGREFRNVRAQTFHSLGFNALAYKLGVRANQFRTDGQKVRNLIRDFYPEDMVEKYSSFVAKLVGLAKGAGIGILCPDQVSQWTDLITHHDLLLEDEDATEDEAIRMAQDVLALSTKMAKEQLWIDFDDMLYLPLLFRSRFYPQQWIFIDEAQDTNPVRRAIARGALKPGGRLIAVGDPHQAIYGFTGASHDAIDLIKRDFNAIELPLTVSYRCPKAIGVLARERVPYFEVHENAPEGEVLTLELDEAIKRLTATDAILCRNVRPLVELAYQLLSRKVACHVLGSEIGKGLVNLVRKMKARNIKALEKRLEEYRSREVAQFMAKGEEGRAESITDRVDCILVFIEALNEKERTIAALISSIESLFTDGSSVLTLSTIHKAKGREWQTVAVYEPKLSPSKWARQEWQAQQEENLIYVRDTRAQQTLIMIPAKDKRPPAPTLGAQEQGAES